MFHRLPEESLLAIVEKMLGELRERLAERKLTLELTEPRASGWSTTASTKSTAPVRCGG